MLFCSYSTRRAPRRDLHFGARRSRCAREQDLRTRILKVHHIMVTRLKGVRIQCHGIILSIDSQLCRQDASRWNDGYKFRRLPHCRAHRLRK